MREKNGATRKTVVWKWIKCVVLICLRLAALLSKVGGIIVGR